MEHANIRLRLIAGYRGAQLDRRPVPPQRQHLRLPDHGFSVLDGTEHRKPRVGPADEVVNRQLLA